MRAPYTRRLMLFWCTQYVRAMLHECGSTKLGIGGRILENSLPLDSRGWHPSGILEIRCSKIEAMVRVLSHPVAYSRGLDSASSRTPTSDACRLSWGGTRRYLVSVALL